MNKNMNILDRRLRAFVAPAAVVIGILIGPGSVGAIVLYAIAAIMLASPARLGPGSRQVSGIGESQDCRSLLRSVVLP